MLRTSRFAVVLTMPVIIAASLLIHPSSLDAATPVATPRISAPPDMLVGEKDGHVDLVVRLSAPGINDVTVQYATTNGSATTGNGCHVDYFPESGGLTFLPGETSKVVGVDIVDACLAVEGFESFTFDLSGPTNGTIVRASTAVGIVDGDTVVDSPGLFVRDAVVDERVGTVSVPVLLGGPSGQASASSVTVHYATSNAGATAGSDYTATSGTLTFAPGETVKNVAVGITNDASAEPAERFGLTLSSPSGATIIDGKGVVVIGANDATKVSSPAISAPRDVVVSEGDGYVDLVVSLSAPSTKTVSVDYITSAGTADPGSTCNLDYLGTSGRLMFATGETTKVVRVDIHDCSDAEGLQSFTFGLSSQVGGTIDRASTRIDIVDNDSGLNVYSYGISNDVYTVVAVNDVVIENPGGGTDQIATALTYTLPANVENLTLTGSSSRNGTGTNASNKLVGNSAANKLSGLGGNDTLDGAGGTDTLTGGPGNDTLTGGTGPDTFVYDSLVGADAIRDFNHTDDTFRFSQAGMPIGDGDATVDGAVTRSAAGGFSKSAELVIFTSNIVGDITTAAAAAKIGSATSSYATGDDRLFIVDNGAQTGIFRFHSSAANATVSAAELSLVAAIDYAAGTASTTLSDFAFAA